MIESSVGVGLLAEVIQQSRTDAARPAHRGHGPGTGSMAHANASATRVDALLQARKSVRSFAARPVCAQAVGRALDAGIAADRELWPEENASGVDLELVLVAWSVDLLEPGVYLREAGAFRSIKGPPARVSRGSVTLQSGLQSAPALVLAAGNLLASCARHGDHGYRLLLSRAGTACHTAWLTAIGEGLAGVVFNGFQPVAARQIFGSSMVRRQLFALALGIPAPTAPM